jgi:ribosomal protein L3 glutamine methyltransferase
MAQARRAPVRERGAALGQIATGARDEALYLILRTLGLPLDSPPRSSAGGCRPRSRARSRACSGGGSSSACRRPTSPARPGSGALRFYVDERVLIPRSYFVEILPAQVDPWLRTPAGCPVADVCTGSGLPRHPARPALQGARVDAIDLSGDALEVAAINVRRHRLGARAAVLGRHAQPAPGAATTSSSVQPAVRADGARGPPPAEFRCEPRLALDGGPDGLSSSAGWCGRPRGASRRGASS